MSSPENDTEYLKLPAQYRGGMKRYIEDRIKPGHLLTACLCDSLVGAISRCDNLENLKSLVSWIYNEAPSTCWGSPDKVKAWLEWEEK